MGRGIRIFPGGLLYASPWLGDAPLWLSVQMPQGQLVSAPREPMEELPDRDDLPTLSAEEEIDRLIDAGVAGKRPACPDLAGQLARAARGRIDTIVLNLLDDEPPLRPNAWLARAFLPSVLWAAGALRSVLGAQRAIVVIDKSAAGWLRQPMQSAAQRLKLDVLPLACRYPQADASLLAYTALGVRIHHGQCPTGSGLLIMDGAGAWAVGQWLLHGRRMTHLPLVLHDHRARRTQALLAPIGTEVGGLLQAMGIEPAAVRLFAGDLARQVELWPEETIGAGPVKLHVLPAGATEPPSPCTRCGHCIEQCPMEIHPAGLLEAAQQADPELARQHGAQWCILCGVCESVCPSRLPLAQSIRRMMKEMTRHRQSVPAEGRCNDAIRVP